MEQEEQRIKHFKIFIGAACALVVVTIVFLYMIFSSADGGYDTNIGNSDHARQDLSSNDLKRVKKMLRTQLGKVYNLDEKTEIDATIRTGTYTENGNSVTFIVDVDTLKATFKVWLSHVSDDDHNIVASCVSPEESKYPNEFCKAMEGHSTIDVSVKKNLPHDGVTKNGHRYRAWHDNYNPVISVYVNTCGDKKIVKEVREDLIEWINSQGYNGAMFPIDIPENCYESMVD